MRRQVGWHLTNQASEPDIISRDLQEAAASGSQKKMDKAVRKICKK